jgi:hypothetical protein
MKQGSPREWSSKRLYGHIAFVLVSWPVAYLSATSNRSGPAAPKRPLEGHPPRSNTACAIPVANPPITHGGLKVEGVLSYGLITTVGGHADQAGGRLASASSRLGYDEWRF